MWIYIMYKISVWNAVCDLVVCIATRYRLEGTGFKPTWIWDFPCPSRPALEPTSFQYNGYGFFFPWGKVPGARRTRIPNSRKNTTIGYIYSLSVPWHIRGEVYHYLYTYRKKIIISLFITIIGIPLPNYTTCYCSLGRILYALFHAVFSVVSIKFTYLHFQHPTSFLIHHLSCYNLTVPAMF